MHLPEPNELSLFQARYEVENPLLLGKLELVLTTDEVEAVAAQIFAAKLQNCVWQLATARIAQPDGFERPVTQRLFAATRKLFQRRTAEEVEPIELVLETPFGRKQCITERVILSTIHRTVE